MTSVIKFLKILGKGLYDLIEIRIWLCLGFNFNSKIIEHVNLFIIQFFFNPHHYLLGFNHGVMIFFPNNISHVPLIEFNECLKDNGLRRLQPIKNLPNVILKPLDDIFNIFFSSLGRS